MKMKLFILGIGLALTTPSILAETPKAGAGMTIYRLNPQIVRESDPVYELLKEDTLAGAMSRMAVTVGSGVQWFRKGYHRQIGLFDLHVRETDMPGSRDLGVRSSISCKLVGNRLRFDLRNDASLDGSSRSVQSANVVFQVRL